MSKPHSLSDYAGFLQEELHTDNGGPHLVAVITCTVGKQIMVATGISLAAWSGERTKMQAAYAHLVDLMSKSLLENKELPPDGPVDPSLS